MRRVAERQKSSQEHLGIPQPGEGSGCESFIHKVFAETKLEDWRAPSAFREGIEFSEASW